MHNEHFNPNLIDRRRAMAQLVMGGAATWAILGDHCGRAQAAPPPPAPASGAKAKSVIQIWLWGGSCHVDTFDPKPGAGRDYCGPLMSPIETNVKGIQIGELLPLLSKQADKYALIRSMSHYNNGHETAAYLMQTGRPPGERLVYPCTGAIVSLFKGYENGYKGLVPPYIVLTEPQGRFAENGFLNAKYKPFATGGNPAAPRFMVDGVVAEGITDEQQKHRRQLLRKVDTLGAMLPTNDQFKLSDECEEKAYDLILGDGAKMFDLNTEKAEVREAYGKNSKFGQSCLMARRLVEKGVPYITINYGGWDTHKQHFEEMRRKLPELDKGLSTLIAELSSRGLLDSTIVWCCGEFGRTPKVDWQAPWNGGRGHFGNVFSAFVAGGGFKGGQVVGESDAKGEHPKVRPIHPQQLIRTMYHLLDINPNATLPNPRTEEAAVPVSPEGVKVIDELV